MADLSDDRIEELHDLAIEDAELTGGSLFARPPLHPQLSVHEHAVYEHAFRNAFARIAGK